MTTISRMLARCEEELHDAAQRKVGFHEFGDPRYREGLRVFLESLDNDRQLTEAGRLVWCDIIVGLLSARLYAQRGWIEQPEVLAVQVRRPLFIVGLPRSGTTVLHKLLSLDGQFQGLEWWLSQAPMVRPLRETWDTRAEYQESVARLEYLYRRIPEQRKAHEIIAGEVEECIPVLMQSFRSTLFSHPTPLPTYDAWLAGQNASESYRYYANVLRLVGARDSRMRWLLKCAFHMVEIGALFELFPDACIIHTHRDPLRSIQSLFSLLNMNPQTEYECQSAVNGVQQCIYWRDALERTHAMYQKRPDKFFHVYNREFREQPLCTIRSIYEYFGLTLSSDAEQRMRAWIAASPLSKYGEHKYVSGPWRLDGHQICEIFANYRARHQFSGDRG